MTVVVLLVVTDKFASRALVVGETVVVVEVMVTTVLEVVALLVVKVINPVVVERILKDVWRMRHFCCW